MTTDQTMRALADAATQGPWGLNSAERASYSEIDKTDCRCSDPNDGEYIFDRLEEEKGHWHRYQDIHHVYGPMNVVIAGNYDYEDGGIIEHQDAEFIAAAREWVPDALERLAITEGAIKLANETTATYKARWRDAVSRNDALEEQIGRVLDLHWGDVSVGIHAHICAECRQEYPCPTIRALDGDMS